MEAGLDKLKIIIENLNIRYRKQHVIKEMNVSFKENTITTILGPSGCGKSTLLMAITRLLDGISYAHVSGKIKIRLKGRGWIDVYGVKEGELPSLRRKVGYIFQQPNVLPMSIYQNVAFPLRLIGKTDQEVEEKVHKTLKEVYLWDEVKDRLHMSAKELSGGQQQRLCLARALVLSPEVLLLDEPTSFLDERAIEKIESLFIKLKKKTTLIIVTHYFDQVRRLSDHVFRMETLLRHM